MTSSRINRPHQSNRSAAGRPSVDTDTRPPRGAARRGVAGLT
ncbi:hypothetical protein ACTWP5_25745 [Streptomyces sp. 4N509B]